MTPQEAAEEAFENYWESLGFGLRDNITDEEIMPFIEAFISGTKWQSEQDNQALSSALKEIAELHAKVRFKKPTPDEVCQFALLFQTESGGKPIDRELLVEMVGFAFMVIDRLYENGDITKPSSEELKNSYRLSPESNPEPDSANLPPESAS